MRYTTLQAMYSMTKINHRMCTTAVRDNMLHEGAQAGASVQRTVVRGAIL